MYFATLFNILSNDIITELKKSKIGIKLFSKLIDTNNVTSDDDYDVYFIFTVCLMFADDLALIAISLRDTQLLINIVAKWVFKIGLAFNPIKCKLLKFIKYDSTAYDRDVSGESIVLPVYSNDTDGIARGEELYDIEVIDKVDNFNFMSLDGKNCKNMSFIDDLESITFNGTTFDFNLKIENSPSISVSCSNDESDALIIRTTVTKNTIGITNIENVKNNGKAAKYLGGLILDLVNNTAHIDDRIKKSSAVLFNIKFNNIFVNGLQLVLARLLICNLLRPGITFGTTFFKFSNKEINRLNTFQNTAMREALRADRETSPAFLRIMLGVCDIEHWIDYLILINYFRISVEVIGSAVNRAFEVSADCFNDNYNIGSINDIEKILNKTDEKLIKLVPFEYLLLLSKYNLLQYWNKNELFKFGTKVQWKKMIKNIVLAVAWNNDWELIKNNEKLKLFYKCFHQSFKDLKPFTLHPIFNSLSKLRENNGFRWLIRVLSGITPFDKKKENYSL